MHLDASDSLYRDLEQQGAFRGMVAAPKPRHGAACCTATRAVDITVTTAPLPLFLLHGSAFCVAVLCSLCCDVVGCAAGKALTQPRRTTSFTQARGKSIETMIRPPTATAVVPPNMTDDIMDEGDMDDLRPLSLSELQQKLQASV
jgi:hypothetical protein